MNRQTTLGRLFLIIGVGIIAIACAPVVLALIRSGEHTGVALPILLVGCVLAIFGAWMLPNSGVEQTTGSMLARFGPYISFGRRAGSGEVSVKPPTSSEGAP